MTDHSPVEGAWPVGALRLQGQTQGGFCLPRLPLPPTLPRGNPAGLPGACPHS